VDLESGRWLLRIKRAAIRPSGTSLGEPAAGQRTPTRSQRGAYGRYKDLLAAGRPRTVVRFLEQVRGDGFAEVVRGERDRTQRDLSSRCCYLPVALTKARGTLNPTNSLLSHALIRLRKAGLAQHDENCGTKSSNPDAPLPEINTNALRSLTMLYTYGTGASTLRQALADPGNGGIDFGPPADWLAFLDFHSKRRYAPLDLRDTGSSGSDGPHLPAGRMSRGRHSYRHQ
jgi:hypothetical protein